MAAKKHVIQVYLSSEEYEFLKVCAEQLNKTMAQTLLKLADFHTRREEFYSDQEEPGVVVGNINFSETPFQDLEDF